MGNDREAPSNIGTVSQRPHAVIALGVAWGLAVAAASLWWGLGRLHDHREQTAATASVRLTGLRDTLALSLKQLAALPLDLSHRAAVPAFVADSQHADAARAGEAQVTLDRVSTDFGLPLAALIDQQGRLVASNRQALVANSVGALNVSARHYFVEAMKSGASVQFLLGRASRVPGLYFANRILNDGQPVGVAVIKQDTETLNKLLIETDSARVFVTDVNGVILLANHHDMLMRRRPGLEPLPEALAEAVYQRVPESLPWVESQREDNGRASRLTRIGGLNHVTLSTTLGNTPLTVWVLEPLSDDAQIKRSAVVGGAVVWAVGCLLIWLSWRHLQALAAALQARRDTFELTRGLPLTVFRYTRPVTGAPHFAFIGRGVEQLFGIALEKFEHDPTLPWRLADGSELPPTQPHEFRLDHSPGREGAAWVLADSTPKTEPDGSTTYNGYWLDITQRRESQARFAAVFEHAAAAYLFFDPQRGVTHCNPAALKMFGTTDPQLLLGRVLWFPGLSAEQQADGAPSRAQALADLHEHTRTGARVRSFEWRFRRASGETFDAEVHVIALEWAGTPEFCAVIQDITDRKQLQAETERARAAAEAASQTKSSFLANMSHELRTPMNAIIGMTHLALDDGLPPKQRDYVQKAHGAARSLLQILNDILDVSKIEAGQMTLERIDFELESVVSEMADVLGLKADEKGLELLFTAAPDLPRRLVGDPSRLRQVLVNLGSNAIKFTDRGEVTVGMAVAHQETDSLEVHGWVRDTGVGLSEAEIARLFQPFVQADASTTRRFGGTGLGLVISRQLIERMGGRLWVESTPGQGSTFHFTARFGRSAPRAPARAWMANELRGCRALLVDDNHAALDVLGTMLESLGVTVVRASSGTEALDKIDGAAVPFAWCLIDWKMPGMDGIECARRILQRHPQMQPSILLVTGFARDDALHASAGVPLAGVLHKPVTPSSLHDCLVQARRGTAPAPLTAQRTIESGPLSQAVRQRLKGARVLLVEDHPLNQQLACELLRRAGIEVVVANDGREALEKLAAEGPFDGVLMDCQMPVMDGYAATRELRSHARWRQLPVIAMTASALAEDRERALASGMNAHITKPIHLESMLRTMADWITGPNALAADEAAGAATPNAPTDPNTGPIDTRAGLAYCMGNHELYGRLLEGFATREASFSTDVAAALAQQRWADALRRLHDTRGLAATIGAQPFVAALQTLHAALTAQHAARATAALNEARSELDRVLREIERQAPSH